MNVPLPAPLQCFNFNKFRSVAMFSHSFGDKLFLQTRSSFLHSLILFLHLILGGLLAVQFFLPVYLEFRENIVVVLSFLFHHSFSDGAFCLHSFIYSVLGHAQRSMTVSRYVAGLFGDENVLKYLGKMIVVSYRM